MKSNDFSSSTPTHNIAALMHRYIDIDYLLSLMRKAFPIKTKTISQFYAAAQLIGVEFSQIPI